MYGLRRDNYSENKDQQGTGVEIINILFLGDSIINWYPNNCLTGN
jgi:hypothetical protein